MYDARDEMTLISELATGGELLETVTQEKYITEIEVARIIIQILEGLEYMHSKSIGHLGLTPCDVLFTRPGKCSTVPSLIFIPISVLQFAATVEQTEKCIISP